MQALISIVRRTDPRILALLVLLFLGIGYTFYKAVDSLSGGESSPEYRRSPPAAFAIPQADIIIDSTLLDDPRLSDNAYKQISENSNEIGNLAVKNKLTPAKLISGGMSKAAAISIVRTLNSYHNSVFYKKNPTLLGDFGLNEINGGLASITRTINYVSSGSDIQLFLVFTYLQDQDNNWSLIGLELSDE